jgi:hypothetical protein
MTSSTACLKWMGSKRLRSIWLQSGEDETLSVPRPLGDNPGRFVKLVPNGKVVEVDEFETTDDCYLVKVRPGLRNLQTEDTFQTLATRDSFGSTVARLMSTHLHYLRSNQLGSSKLEVLIATMRGAQSGLL